MCAYTLSVCLFALFKTKDTNLVHAGMLTQMIRAIRPISCVVAFWSVSLEKSWCNTSTSWSLVTVTKGAILCNNKTSWPLLYSRLLNIIGKTVISSISPHWGLTFFPHVYKGRCWWDVHQGCVFVPVKSRCCHLHTCTPMGHVCVSKEQFVRSYKYWCFGLVGQAVQSTLQSTVTHYTFKRLQRC